MSAPPSLGAAPARVPVDTAQVRRLVTSQFPQWSDLRIELVAKGGWDNWTFHLGDDMLVRLPSAAEDAQAVEKEHRWLPALAERLPVPNPAPLAKGAPSLDYPHPWSVYRWIEGRPATSGLIADPVGFAIELVEFLSALQVVDPAGGPQPGIHTWFRGGPLRTFDDTTQRALHDLRGHIDVDRTAEDWADALSAPWDGVDRWFHGDVAEGNLLLDDAGHLTAVIDFGTCGVGDPACDRAVAWTLLTADGPRGFSAPFSTTGRPCLVAVLRRRHRGHGALVPPTVNRSTSNVVTLCSTKWL